MHAVDSTSLIVPRFALVVNGTIQSKVITLSPVTSIIVTSQEMN